MRETSNLIKALKRLLKARGVNYAVLADKMTLSESSIKRIFSDESFTLERLEEVCEILDISFLELARLSEAASRKKVDTLTPEQEEILSLNLHLFQVYYLILRQWEVEDIGSAFGIEWNVLQKALLELDKLKVIELLPNNRVKLLTSRNIRWIKNGPIYKLFEAEVRANFLNQRFDQDNQKFLLMTGSLTPESQLLVKSKVQALQKEVDELIELEANFPKDQTQSSVLLVALGPMSLTIFQNQSLKKG